MKKKFSFAFVLVIQIILVHGVKASDCINFPDPIQDGVTAQSSYEFEQDGDVKTISALAGLTVRRALLRDGKFYVLAVDASKVPQLLIINPETGSRIREMSIKGLNADVITVNGTARTHHHILSDIAFTADGVLIGANSTSVGNTGNGNQTGSFYMYKWEADDADPETLLTLPTDNVASVFPSGNNNSNFMANSIAVSGCSDDFKFFFDSHPGRDWTTSYGIRIVCWEVQDGARANVRYNDTKYNTVTHNGEKFSLNVSPLGDDRWILSGGNILPTEILFNWDNPAEGIATNGPSYTDFSEDLPDGASGASYFKYAGKIYMSAPVYESSAYSVYLFDITGGFDAAKKIGEIKSGITGGPNYVTSPVVVDDADMSVYLLVGDKLVKYSTDLGTGILKTSGKKSIQAIRTSSGIEIKLDGPSKIELYGVSGQLIDKAIASGTYSRNLANGVYIVRVNGEVVKFVK